MQEEAARDFLLDRGMKQVSDTTWQPGEPLFCVMEDVWLPYHMDDAKYSGVPSIARIDTATFLQSPVDIGGRQLSLVHWTNMTAYWGIPEDTSLRPFLSRNGVPRHALAKGGLYLDNAFVLPEEVPDDLFPWVSTLYMKEEGHHHPHDV